MKRSVLRWQRILAISCLILAPYVAYSQGAATAAAIEDWELLLTLNGHTNRVESVTWSPDGLYIASGSADLMIGPSKFGMRKAET
ncbi:MAG: hypothetical protein HY232_11725 [Acidobacteria bacterium]|nr:hypothetical protein [Acidobacteriota bacterium]